MSIELHEIRGEVTRVMRWDNGYTVLTVQPEKMPKVILTGTMPNFVEGMNICAKAKIVNHPKYGEQYQVEEIHEEGFCSKSSIVDYLSSSAFFGIGKVIARNIVDTFGMDTLSILDDDPERLKEVPGIAKGKCTQLIKDWQEQRAVHRIMTELMGFGMPANMAMKVYNYFKENAVSIVKDDPYALIEIPGISFHKADEIALNMGERRKSPKRIRAAIIFALESAMYSGGHCYMIKSDLASETIDLLNQDVNHFEIGESIKNLKEANNIVVENDKVYLVHIHAAEVEVSQKIKDFIAWGDRKLYDTIDDLRKDIAKLGLSITLSEKQEEAIFMVLNSRVAIITGGPGTGKTTITQIVCMLLEQHGISFDLCAPTGRAAKRLAEATERSARTIHRLLQYIPGEGFTYNAACPLETNCVLVDESSMVDVLLFRHLLAAMESDDRLIMVGDADQLPSVGAGNVLRDLIASDVIPVVKLEVIYRQAEGSSIISAAHDILKGNVPELPSPAKRKGKNCMLVACDDKETLISYILQLVEKHLPAVGIDKDNVQILTPMRGRGLGINDLNPKLQEVINPAADNKVEINSDFRILRTGDRIMQIRNDYEKGVFNGDIGKIAGITKIDDGKHILYVEYPDLEDLVEYPQCDWTDLQLAYACTIHKSQGCEYPAVILILHPSQYNMLQRNLFYTGLTRAKQFCIVAGTSSALETAVNNNRETKRNTTLKERVREYIELM